MKKIGILTAGGDTPGLNAAIRGIGKSAIELGIDHDTCKLPRDHIDEASTITSVGLSG